nr:hypothetical protein [Tanacetum cinerariifolium]
SEFWDSTHAVWDDDFSDDDSEGVEEAEVWEVNEEWLMAPVTQPPVPAMQPPSVYEVGGPSTAAEGPSFQLPAPGLPVPPSVIEDLSTRLEKHTDSAAADYGFEDEQP